MYYSTKGSIKEEEDDSRLSYVWAGLLQAAAAEGQLTAERVAIEGIFFFFITLEPRVE